jgi:hypothetical protein
MAQPTTQKLGRRGDRNPTPPWRDVLEVGIEMDRIDVL